MPLKLEDILQMDEWTDAEQATVRQALSADVALSSALTKWLQLSDSVQSSWNEDVPSRETLVLLALSDELNSGVISADEEAARTDALHILESAKANHPGLSIVLDRIREESLAFDNAWSEAFSDDEALQPGSGLSNVSDRGPLASRTNSSHTRTARPRLRLVQYALSAAAVVAFLAVGINLVNNTSESSGTTWASEVGQWKTISLNDGTEVRLGPESWLETEGADDAGARSIRFNGTAFFEVTPSPLPFTIETGEALTTVLGTSFGIRTLLEAPQSEVTRGNTTASTEVTLISGRVSIAPIDNPSNAQILTPGQQGIVSDGSETPRIRDVNLTRELSWMDLIVFKDTPMSEVAESLSERFSVDIELTENLELTPLTGTFETDSGVKTILEIIASALGAELTSEEEDKFALAR